MRSRWPAEVGVLLSIAVASAWLWSKRVEGPATVELNLWGNSDQFTYFHPLYKLAGRRWADGELPLWNPWQLAGLPLAATPQTSAFYPPNLLYAFLPTHTAMEVLAFGHLVLAAFLLYAFARTLRAARVAAALGGLAFAWSSYVVAWHLWPPALGVLAWFPAPLLGIALVQRGRPLAGCYVIGVGLAMQMFIGHPPLLFYGFQVAALYAGWNVLQPLAAGDARRALRLAAWMGGGAALALLVSSVQWLPTLELSRLATRNPGGLTSTQIEPFGPPKLATVLLTQLQPSAGFSAYGGVLVLLLLPVAWLRRKHRPDAWFFGGVALVFGLLALGSATPLFGLYLKLPGANMFRAPARAMCVFVLAVSVLAALGANALVEPRSDRTAPTKRALWGALGATLLVAAGSTLVWPVLPRWLAAAGVVVMLACVFAPSRWLRYLAIALLGVHVADLALVPPTTERQIWRPGARAPLYALGRQYRSLAEDLGHKRVLVAHDPRYRLATYPRNPTRQRLYVFADYEPLSLRRYADYANYLQRGQLYDPAGGRRTYAGDLDYRAPLLHPRLLAAAGVHAIVRVSMTKNRLPLLKLEPVPGALPRAYLVHGIKAAESAEATLRTIADGTLRLNQEVVLESPPAAAVRYPAGGASSNERVRVVHYAAERVSVEAVLERPGALVLLDADYPGWKTTVNGRPAPIFNANYLFRAVLLEAGHHDVAFVYAPSSLRWGFTLSLFGLAAALTLAAARWRSIGWTRKRTSEIPGVPDATHA